MKAKLIHKIYTGFKKSGAVNAKIKNVVEIAIKIRILSYLCLKKMKRVIKTSAIPIVTPNFLSDFLSMFNFSIILI